MEIVRFAGDSRHDADVRPVKISFVNELMIFASTHYRHLVPISGLLFSIVPSWRDEGDDSRRFDKSPNF
jgi:hypothetical protein